MLLNVFAKYWRLLHAAVMVRYVELGTLHCSEEVKSALLYVAAVLRYVELGTLHCG